MSDIIKVAQDLQSDLYDELDDWIERRGGIEIEMPLDSTVLYGDGEAGDVIKAMAEETWEYAIAFKSLNGTAYVDRDGQAQPWISNAAWYSTQESVRRALRVIEYRDEGLIIVRRRVSQPEIYVNTDYNQH